MGLVVSYCVSPESVENPPVARRPQLYASDSSGLRQDRQQSKQKFGVTNTPSSRRTPVGSGISRNLTIQACRLPSTAPQSKKKKELFPAPATFEKTCIVCERRCSSRKFLIVNLVRRLARRAPIRLRWSSRWKGAMRRRRMCSVISRQHGDTR